MSKASYSYRDENLPPKAKCFVVFFCLCLDIGAVAIFSFLFFSFSTLSITLNYFFLVDIKSQNSKLTCVCFCVCSYTGKTLYSVWLETSGGILYFKEIIAQMSVHYIAYTQ